MKVQRSICFQQVFQILGKLKLCCSLLLCLVLCWSISGVLNLSQAAFCTALNAQDRLPEVIKSEQCFELQGGNIIDTPTTVRGRLFVKAGRKVSLAPNASLVILDGGRFTVRGLMDIAANSQISVDHNGSLENIGQIILQSSSVLNTRGQVNIKNSGKLYAQTAGLIELSGNTKFLNSGIIDLAEAHFRMNQESQLKNQGSILFHPRSFLQLTQQALLYNDGSLILYNDCNLELKNYARLFSRNPVTLDGQISMRNQSIFENFAAFKLQPNAEFKLLDSAQIYNRHNFIISGRFNVNENARFLNEGLCRIEPQGTLRLQQNSTFLNTGTFENNHGNLQMATAQNFVNKHIISGQMSQQSRNPSAIIPKQTQTDQAPNIQ